MKIVTATLDGRQAAQSPVLIVGAGPTGLALAAQLAQFGIRFRIIDRALDRARESRALAMQARTLELFQSIHLSDTLVVRGNKSARLLLHFEGSAPAEIRLGQFGASDTRFPFILFISQAETEALLAEHLASAGVTIQRGVELVDFVASGDGIDVVLRNGDGSEENIRAAYLVGCDGAHSIVRKRAGIPFGGDAYLQDFMLGDVEADAVAGTLFERNALHSFAGRQGIAMFFPLGHPATWRVVAMPTDRPKRERRGQESETRPITDDLSLSELQVVVDSATAAAIRLHDPVWLSHFRLHHRQAARYRVGRVFIAGDAGHVHSPVGAQGMNTGIQDAWNLGWKLALVLSGVADPLLLDSYEAERWPVGRTLLRYTDRIFGIFTSVMASNALAVWVRRKVVARVLPRVMRAERLRAFAFRFVSEFSINYRRSPIVSEGAPKLDSGPQAGDRLPDVALTKNGEPTTLQRELSGPNVHLLLCGEADAWSERANDVARLRSRLGPLLTVHHLARSEGRDILLDRTGVAFAMLGIRGSGQYFVRPDGYVAYRCAGTDLGGLERYLARWFSRPLELRRDGRE